MTWRTYFVASLFLVACAGAMLLGACSATRMASRYPGLEGGRAAVPGALPSPDEELWVIAKGPAEEQPAAVAQEQPGAGALMAKVPGQQEQVPVPLKHTDVKASIAGYIATVDVTQQYHNPFNEKIEAVYLFPLPHNAAVSEFVMTIGSRRIRGVIRERAEAEAIYQAARAQGYVASLLTQERPNIFTQAVANIEPGKEIDINIRYFHTLAYSDGSYEFHFPMVIGPRYNPSGSTDGVGAVGRDGRGSSGQKTEVQYLKPTERSGHDISLSVHVDAGVAIEKLECPSHLVSKSQPKPEQADVALAETDRIPNRDFVLRYQVAGKAIKSSLLAQRDQKGGGYFTLMLFPPENLSSVARKPLEVVFVIDSSGSMTGYPLEKVKSAVRRGVRRLDKNDTFQVINFSNESRQMNAAPVPASPANIDRALAYVDALQPGGGTEMLTGVRASLNFPHDPERLRSVVFLTDGYIGNETDILREVHNRLGAARIFSFGVGTSVNRYLLEHMAKLGSGAVAYIGAGDSPEQVMDAYFDRISHPAMTDIAIDWGDTKVSDVFPERRPDLFVGRPVVLTGRFTSPAGAGTIRVRGKVNGQEQQIGVPASFTDAAHGGLPAVWARMKIADLADRSAWEPNNELPAQIKNLALEYGLMSAYTAFVAVDATTRTAGDHGTTVVVPVPVPEGVRYDTTVDEGRNPARRGE